MARAFQFPLLILLVGLLACEGRKSGVFWGNEADMRGYFEGADTPEEEYAAAKELNERFSRYEVTAFNVAGDEIFPHRDGDYDAVHRVKISLADSDVEASRVISNRDSLILIYGE